MTILIWTTVFIVSLALLVKSSDWLLETSEKIGIAVGLSPFIVGVTIVAFGTSFPELVSSLVAVSQGVSEIVVANAVGSNIANILLVVSISVLVARRLVVSKDLIDLDLPLLAISTSIFLILAWDGEITLIDGIFLLISYIIYLFFAVVYKEGADKKEAIDKPKITFKDILILVVGIAGLALGAKYLIDSIVTLSGILNIGAGLITITAVAIGTSLPELIVSSKAALKGQSEVALGNIFGSNIFNVLVVVGFPALFGNLNIDAQTLSIGFPILIISTILFIVSGISKRIHLQEGFLFLLIYIIFIGKLFGLF